jgi:hypothetical protein
MVEEIITALSRIGGLFVIARNSTFTYKGRAVDVKQVGRELGVRHVLEGSVRKGRQREIPFLGLERACLEAGLVRFGAGCGAVAGSSVGRACKRNEKLLYRIAIEYSRHIRRLEASVSSEAGAKRIRTLDRQLC